MQARTEFRLIDRLRRLGAGTGVALGIGDDAALLEPSAGSHLVAATDTLVAGVHFPDRTRAEDLGYKALAVNLSDLAAMGARPRWALLALTLPEANEPWLDEFADGWQELAAETGVSLVGGDLTQGPLTITVEVLGEVPAGQALRRAGARPGDRIAVTGTLGAAALALRHLEAGETPAPPLLECLNRPRPRLAAGRALRGLASACIDVSDGLAADLSHLVEASAVGARIDLARLPLAEPLRGLGDEGVELALSGGDDYELCFSYEPALGDAVAAALAATETPVTEIGEITAEAGIAWRTAGGERFEPKATGYGHFEG